MNPEFKKGDKVKIKHYCSNLERGEIAILKLDEDGALGAAGIQGRRGFCTCKDNWEKIEPETNETEISNLIESNLL